MRLPHPGSGVSTHTLSLFCLDVAIEIDVGDAGLDEREVALVVADENAVHALQIDRDAAAHVRRRAAVGEVLARRDRVQRNLVLVRRADDRLHLLRRIGADGRRRDQLVRLVLDVREVVAIRVEIVVAREHPVAADGVLKLANGRLKRLGTDSGRQDRHSPSSTHDFGRDRGARRDDPGHSGMSRSDSAAPSLTSSARAISRRAERALGQRRRQRALPRRRQRLQAAR